MFNARAVAMGQVADILKKRGDLDGALRILEKELLPAFERFGDTRGRAVTYGKDCGHPGSAWGPKGGVANQAGRAAPDFRTTWLSKSCVPLLWIELLNCWRHWTNP